MATSKAARIRRQTAQPPPAGLAGAEARAWVIGGELVDGLRAAPPPPVAAPHKECEGIGAMEAQHLVKGTRPLCFAQHPIDCKAKRGAAPRSWLGCRCLTPEAGCADGASSAAAAAAVAAAAAALSPPAEAPEPSGQAAHAAAGGHSSTRLRPGSPGCRLHCNNGVELGAAAEVSPPPPGGTRQRWKPSMKTGNTA
jgi:hypothetical protein